MRTHRSARSKPVGPDAGGLADLVASLRVLIADLGVLQPPEALQEFELAAVGRCIDRRITGRQDLTALGARLAARNAELIRRTRLLN